MTVTTSLILCVVTHDRSRVLAVIPARRGSRGLPGKHLRMLGGLPLIAHTIRAALAATRIDHVLVSTDDPAIRKAAIALGAEAPFLRPAALATDVAATAPVVVHAVTWYEARAGRTSAVVVLQPTSPLRTATQIDAAVALLDDPAADSVVSVASTGYATSVLGTVGDGRWYALADPTDVRRQASPEAFRLTGGIYVIRREVLSPARMLGKAVAALVVDEASAIDIDTADDLRHARAELRARPR